MQNIWNKCFPSNRTWARRAAAISVSSVLLLSAAACGTASETPQNSNGEAGASEDFSVGVFPVFVSLPAWVAEDQGMFSKHGLNVTLKTINTGPTMVSALASNSVDAIVNGLTGVETARAGGLPIKMVAVTYPHSIYSMLASNDVIDGCREAGKPYPKPIQCAKGKRVGIVGGVGTESYTVALSVLKEAGLTEQDVSMVPIGGGEAGGGAMEAGQIDIQFAEDTGAAYTTQVLKVGKDLVNLKTEGVFANWIGEAMWAMEPNLQKSPAAYEKFAAAIDEAVEWIRDPSNTDALAATFKKYVPTLNPGTISAVSKDTAPFFGSTSTCSSVQNVTQWLVSTGALTSSQAPACEDLLSNPAQVTSTP
ncbi:ABC transporter substrate-binding protein [Rhodococcus sp. OK302]|uniref:ABC transporter substrate-binding protein n=1 Tax=Rhodococcus sp. OK302 TaxID=1882769 RepID=UPI000B944AD2|nr:ABC transporter substrate-binding protein [Rhodococcus sp. OK302]OYD69905.1 ABC-type nitrate/sulfonate/bicarbonate transport system substrate-binding protein [Rhodococcus sp. OK302]